MFRATNKISRLAPIPLAMCGCVGTDLPDCPPAEPEMIEVMIVTSIDAATQQDITISNRIDDGTLFFFNDRLRLMDNGYIQVPRTQLGVEKPFPADITFTRAKGDRLWISAWGNIANNFDIEATPMPGDDISREFLYMKPHATYEGYSAYPGEVLFGMRRIHLGEIDHPVFDRIDTLENGTLKLTHEIQITQLNALLWVQVEGLPAGYRAEDYYLVVCNQNSGYNYEGAPFAEDEMPEMRGRGMIDPETGFLVSRVPRNLVPSLDPDNINAENAVEVHLYKAAATRAEADTDLTGAVNKTTYGTGDYIGLYSRKTTEVYIKFTGDPTDPTEPGVQEFEVAVRVVDWEGNVVQGGVW